MAPESDLPTGDPSDFESGVAALRELVPDMGTDAIRRAVRHLASVERIDSGTCAQMLRTEIEAGRFPVDRFKAAAQP